MTIYDVLKEELNVLEQLNQQGWIDLFYGDETRISELGYIPYGWQFKDEDIYIPVQRGKGLNCFGLLSRDITFYYEIAESSINSDFIIEYLDNFSFKIKKESVIVLDMSEERTSIWEMLVRVQDEAIVSKNSYI